MEPSTQAIAAFGGIDILVNNVGGGEAQGPVEDFTEAEFDDMVALNVKSAFFCRSAWAST